MSDELNLVQTYEPVLRYSKDGEGNSERFFPVAARYYVHACGLRRRREGWEHPPGKTLLMHLGELWKPDECYLVYAAGDVQDSDIIPELLDQGLELSRIPEPMDGPGMDFDAVPGDSPVVPRILASKEEADALEQYLEKWGGSDRQPPNAHEIAKLFNGDEPDVAYDIVPTPETLKTLPEPDAVPLGAEMAVAGLEWVIPKGFAGLPDAILRQALKKYAPYRDWRIYPPTYHYRVCQDGPFRVLQYWFLYAYNDWAAHGGQNDHEGDWEVIYVFLDEQDRPQHVAYSRHVKIPWLYEPTTARWSEVERVEGTHPVVYVGCGSHASYLDKGTRRILWYLDHAQGDDVSIGPGTDQAWGEPVGLSDKPWNLRFSGRWGSLIKSWLGMVFPGTEGPTGPAQKGSKWRHPARWAGLV
jgi:hypothetical protein